MIPFIKETRNKASENERAKDISLVLRPRRFRRTDNILENKTLDDSNTAVVTAVAFLLYRLCFFGEIISLVLSISTVVNTYENISK